METMFRGLCALLVSCCIGCSEHWEQTDKIVVKSSVSSERFSIPLAFDKADTQDFLLDGRLTESDNPSLALTEGVAYER